MAKKRVAVGLKKREQVLGEFNHRCALCGADRPQIHHMDEDPGNNDPLNLLPLCPNCHLIDLHNPTAPVNVNQLRLFRRYKDPVILSPQFEPLFKRLCFLDEVRDNNSAGDLRSRVRELIAFIRALQMGEFYASQIGPLLAMSDYIPSYEYAEQAEAERLLSVRAGGLNYLTDRPAAAGTYHCGC